MCFRRIIWGQGPHILYYDVLTLLRRMTTEFARYFVKNMYSIRYPVSFQIPSSNFISVKSTEITSFNHSNLLVPLQVNNSHPLRVVLFSRGESGKGRSMQGESMLIEKLKQLGILAVSCCDFEKTSMEDQIAFAYHADVVSFCFSF